jgi:hypothetical protein
MNSGSLLLDIMTFSKAKRGRWVKDEDAMLVTAVNIYGNKHWKLVATMVPNRTALQC